MDTRAILKYQRISAQKCRLVADSVRGLKVDEPALDIAIIIAIISSLKETVISQRLAAIGEVGLTGELRSVNLVKKRLMELKKMGFNTCILPQKNKSKEIDNIEINLLYMSNLQEVIHYLFYEVS